MKPVQSATFREAVSIPTHLAGALTECVREFHLDGSASISEQVPRLAFCNAVMLGAEYPAGAAELRRHLEDEGVEPGLILVHLWPFSLTFRFEGDWIAGLDGLLSEVWESAEVPADDLRGRTLKAFLAGLMAAESLKQFPQSLLEAWVLLDEEPRFLLRRLLVWWDNGWRPRHSPFVEFVEEFYGRESVTRKVMVGSALDVHSIVRAFSDPWEIRVWADTGWTGGRRAVAHYPDCAKAITAELPEGRLPRLVELYRSCVVPTTGSDGAVRPLRAVLRFFSLRERRDYPGVLCRGDQPRLLAHAAFEFCFWMGILSTQPIPCQAAPARQPQEAGGKPS